MDNLASASSQQKLDALRVKYRQQLANYKAQLESARSVLFKSSGQVNEVMDIAHRLAGSGKAYGFSDLSVAAKALDVACDSYLLESATSNSVSNIEQTLQLLLNCLERDSCLQLKNSILTDPSTRNLSVHNTDSGIGILLVDDDLDFSSWLAEKLSRRGYVVHCLQEIDHLIETVSRIEPHAILVDMDFYGERLAGAEQISLWRHHDGSPLPVIFISSFDSFEVRLAAVRAGGNHFLKKPLDEERLMSLLRSELSIKPDEPYRVLIVDDDEDLLELYKSSLSEAGYHVSVANSAQEALFLLEQDDPELALIDVKMPGCSGIELGRLIRQHEEFAGIPLLFMSASVDTDVQLACARLANDEFFSKPLELWRLLMIVKSRVSRSRHLNSTKTHLIEPTLNGEVDVLTALPRLRVFRQRLEQALQKSKPDQYLALIKLDIRYFHEINNLYGHFRGDQVLQKLAWTLSEKLNADDLLCRESGDEFFILTEGHESKESIVHYANLLVAAVEQSCISEDYVNIALSVDLGIAVASQVEKSAEDLLQNADTALFLAKKAASSEIRVFDQSMQQSERSRFVLSQDVKQALLMHQFIAVFQPIFSVKDCKLVGFEALARWVHPSRGMLGPADFIPLMEQQGLICQLTETVLNQSLLQLSHWQSKKPHLFMSINLSACDIQRPVFLSAP